MKWLMALLIGAAGFGLMADDAAATRADVRAFGAKGDAAADGKFAARQVDAVMIPGDIAEDGSELEQSAVAAAWEQVFPKGLDKRGQRVERLLIRGNLNFGRGAFDIGGNAKINVTSVGDYNSIVIASASSDKGRTTTFNFADNASLEATGLKYFIFGKGDMRATGIRSFFNLSGGTIKLGYHSDLGTGQGI